MVESAATVFPAKVPLRRFISVMGEWFIVIDLTRYSWGTIGHAEGWGFAAKTGESAESGNWKCENLGSA